MTSPDETALVDLDHDVARSSRSSDIVIDSNEREHDVVRKPVPTFRHHALRRRIDALGEDLVRRLARRLDCVNAVVAVERRDGPPARNGRVEEILGRVRARAEAAGIPPAFTQHVWRAMIEWIIAYEDQALSPPPGSHA